MNLSLKLLALSILWLSFWRLSELPADIAKIELSSIFGSNMVLERDQPNWIWGTATPRDHIQILIASKCVGTTVSSDGTWSARVPALPAGGPYELIVQGINRITLHNILVGDVWLCAGQSNMDMDLGTAIHSPADVTEADYPTLRFFKAVATASPEPAKDIRGTWLVMSPKTASSCSAVAYYFAREVALSAKVPIGLIQCAKSSTPIKAWISKEALGGTPRKLAKCATSSLFNGMIAPILGFSIKGVLWYQGESDIFEGSYQSYKKLLCSLFRDWRQRWHQENLPFLCVQIQNYFRSYEYPTDSPWAQLREAQFQACSSTPNTYMAVAIDTGEGQIVDLHPKSKREIGHRLALIALAVAYGRQRSFISPSFSSLRITGNQARISFQNTGKGLVIKGEAKTLGFAISGADQNFYWADAEIEPNGKEVLVSSERVANPVAVRYAWADNPKCNLYSREGLPVLPFRTDTWKNDSTQQYAAFWNSGQLQR